MSFLLIRRAATEGWVEERFEPGEREIILDLVRVLYRIEHCCVAPYWRGLVGILFSVPLSILLVYTVGHMMTENQLTAALVALVIISYAGKVWLFKVLIFNKRRDNAIRLLRDILTHYPELIQAAEGFMERDPDLCRSVKKHVHSVRIDVESHSAAKRIITQRGQEGYAGAAELIGPDNASELLRQHITKQMLHTGELAEQRITDMVDKARRAAGF